jgi:hypothetical protein
MVLTNSLGLKMAGRRRQIRPDDSALQSAAPKRKSIAQYRVQRQGQGKVIKASAESWN